MMSTSTARVVENVTQSLTVLFRTTPTWAPSTHDKLTIIFQKVSCRWFFLPAGIQLKDFIALHTVLRDKTDDGLLNVQKMIRLAHIMSPLLPGHSSQPPIQPNMDLIKMLRVRGMGSYTLRKLKGAGGLNLWNTGHPIYIFVAFLWINYDFQEWIQKILKGG